MSNNVVSIFKNRDANKDIRSMDKMQLLEEMVRFQEERSALGQEARMTKPMILRGIAIFTGLEKTCDTPEMYSLASSYRRHLQITLDEMK
jgi:hypothetical protein